MKLKLKRIKMIKLKMEVEVMNLRVEMMLTLKVWIDWIDLKLTQKDLKIRYRGVVQLEMKRVEKWVWFQAGRRAAAEERERAGKKGAG